jgi:hypothetical protein
VPTYVRDRVKQRGAVLVAAVLLVAAGGPFAGLTFRGDLTACTLLSERVFTQLYGGVPVDQKLDSLPGRTAVRDLTGYWSPPGSTLCALAGSPGRAVIYEQAQIEVVSRDARHAYEAAKAGRPGSLDIAVLYQSKAPAQARSDWQPRRLEAIGGYEAFVADQELFVLKHGLYVHLAAVSLVPPEQVAALVASRIPERLVWWDPISWLHAALP